MVFQQLTSVQSVATSLTGWTDQELTFEWIKNVLIPYALEHRVDVSKPILITCDGHDSHETP